MPGLMIMLLSMVIINKKFKKIDLSDQDTSVDYTVVSVPIRSLAYLEELDSQAFGSLPEQTDLEKIAEQVVYAISLAITGGVIGAAAILSIVGIVLMSLGFV